MPGLSDLCNNSAMIVCTSLKAACHTCLKNKLNVGYFPFPSGPQLAGAKINRIAQLEPGHKAVLDRLLMSEGEQPSQLAWLFQPPGKLIAKMTCNISTG